MRTWPSWTTGLPLAWKATKSIGEPVSTTCCEEPAQEGLRLRVGEGAAGVRAADAGAGDRALIAFAVASYIAQNSGIVPVQ